MVISKWPWLSSPLDHLKPGILNVWNYSLEIHDFREKSKVSTLTRPKNDNFIQNFYTGQSRPSMEWVACEFQSKRQNFGFCCINFLGWISNGTLNSFEKRKKKSKFRIKTFDPENTRKLKKMEIFGNLYEVSLHWILNLSFSTNKIIFMILYFVVFWNCLLSNDTFSSCKCTFILLTKMNIWFGKFIIDFQKFPPLLYKTNYLNTKIPKNNTLESV